MDPPELHELEDAIKEYREQLAALATVISDNPHDQEAKEVAIELAEALSAAEAAYAACCPASSIAPQNSTEVTQQQDQATLSHGASSSADELPCTQQHAEASASLSTAVPALVVTGHPGRSTPRMHPANLYCNREPDFAALAQLHAPLASYVTLNAATGRGSIDFTSWDATKELTAALLSVDFGIKWDLPAGQLVPPVPNRANYIHWLHDLLQLSAPPGPVVRGLDIGCGTNFIYCLLGAALYGWHMTGADVTTVALEGAAAIMAANPHIADLLEVRQSHCTVGQLPQRQQLQHEQHEQQQAQLHGQQEQQQAGHIPVLGPVMGALADDLESFAFCMCNPPFFTSIKEANQNPNTACGGTAEEMVVPGGELAFIRAMIADSQLLRGRIHWYSSMCGKKATLKALRQELHQAGVTAVRTTELVQGKTSRWAIAWSFTADRNTSSMPLQRHSLSLQHQQQMQHLQDTSGNADASKASFRVTAAAADGRKVLQSIAALLGAVANATQVQVDTSAWNISCQISVPAASLRHLLQSQEDTPPSKRARMESEPALDKQSQSGAAERLPGGAVPVHVSVYQQQRGAFDVVATIHKQQNTTHEQHAVSSAFVAALRAVREDLTLMWPVTSLQLL